MKLPAVAIAAAFASGIALGLHPVVARHASSLAFLSLSFLAVALLVTTGMVFLKFGRLFLAAAASLLSWIFLGCLCACVAEQPRPANHILSLVGQGRIRLGTPLRWHGHLRDEPERLPWGYGCEIELSGVEFEGELQPTKGGLRLSFTMYPDQALPPELHAGDEIAVLTEAKRPQVFMDEGAFDRRAYLEQQDIHLVATLRAPQLIERVSSPHPTAGTRLAGVRRQLRDEVDGLFAGKPQVAGVLRAMLLGDRSFVDRTESTNFQKTGVFHVLVIAGLHVGALAFALYWICRKLRFTPVWRAVFTLTLLFSYVAVVEQRAPVLRATLMAAIVVLGGFFFRRLDLLNSTGLAAPWLEKTVQPYVRALRGWREVTRNAAHEPRAAQFRIDLRSVARWIGSRVPQQLSKTAEDSLAGGLSLTLRVWELLAITLALQFGMLPLMARDFHRITLSGPLVNLAAVPLTGVVVPLGFLALATGLGWQPLGKILAVPLAWLTELLLHIVQWFAHFPRGSYRIPGPPWWLIVAFFGVAVLLAAMTRSKQSPGHKLRRSLYAAWATCALAVAVFPFGSRWSKGKLEVTILDVGQGDSLFVVSPGGKILLIDGGGAFGGFPGHEEQQGVDPGEEAVSPYLWWRGFQKLDVVALTHAHQDHLGGLTAVFENFRVGKLWIGREVSTAALTQLEDLAREKKIPIEHEVRGKKFSWDGAEGEFLWPESSRGETALSAKNDDSLVLRLRYGNQSLLLAGDAEKESERAILAENDANELRADVLKIGHHGSKNSTMPEFLSAVQPRIGIISSGEGNPYGHPSPELLERLEKAGVRIYRTDFDGAVHVLTDGTRLKISCFVACPEAGRTASSVQSTEQPKQLQHKKEK